MTLKYKIGDIIVSDKTSNVGLIVRIERDNWIGYGDYVYTVFWMTIKKTIRHSPDYGIESSTRLLKVR